MQKEIWKDVPDYEDYYQISNCGRVKSKDRIVKTVFGKGYRTVKGIIKKNLFDGVYYSTSLSKNGKTKSIRIHLLMAITFLNHKPSRKLVVDHINNNQKDNRIENLQIITNRENSSKDKHRYNKTSKYIGVCKVRDKWISGIRFNGVKENLGTFDTEIEAHKAYQRRLKEIQC